MFILTSCVNEQVPTSNIVPNIFKPQFDTLAHIRDYALSQEKIAASIRVDYFLRVLFA